MKECIELVKKWLDDNESVSLEELEENYTKLYTVSQAVYSASYCAATAQQARYVHPDFNARTWVKRYEELTKEPDA